MTVERTPEPWPWPDALDAVVAAPRHHTVLLENDRVRVLDVRIAPGETVPVHTHRWPGVQYVLSWEEFIRRDGDGRLLLDTRTATTGDTTPTVLWTGPLPPHSVENVGTRELHIIAIEVKDG